MSSFPSGCPIVTVPIQVCFSRVISRLGDVRLCYMCVRSCSAPERTQIACTPLRQDSQVSKRQDSQVSLGIKSHKRESTVRAYLVYLEKKMMESMKQKKIAQQKYFQFWDQFRGNPQTLVLRISLSILTSTITSDLHFGPYMSAAAFKAAKKNPEQRKIFVQRDFDFQNGHQNCKETAGGKDCSLVSWRCVRVRV